jgi:hypothetical protein
MITSQVIDIINKIELRGYPPRLWAYAAARKKSIMCLGRHISNIESISSKIKEI